ncbi:hypothetical protein [Candidatus Similichlamydia epinepheli]|uniref:hypothetical protein n=1 Tax=Candidatus Similichlamydia epinepheli TaxID=1903953 RepID=UPI001300550C|nr:hypothetical protein [Candidatus Similichlamydia epinepheli]
MPNINPQLLPNWENLKHNQGYFQNIILRIAGTTSTLSNADTETLYRLCWEHFIRYKMPELQNRTSFDTDKTQFIDKDKLFSYSFVGMDHYAESLFRSNINYIFGDYFQNRSVYDRRLTETIPEYIARHFESVMRTASLPKYIDPNKSHEPVLWVWQLLLEVMKSAQKTSLNKATAAVTFTLREEKAVEKMGQIEFEVQVSDDDYTTIKENMDAQQESENHRNWRSIIGKSTAQYQNDVQTAIDSRTQFSQLATKMIQDMESVLSAITRIG